jgi:hypothetical protein
MNNAQLIETFTKRAAEYQRRIRTVAQELRDLRALEHAQAFVTEHTGKPNQDMDDAISMLEECIVDSIGLEHARD